MRYHTCLVNLLYVTNFLLFEHFQDRGTCTGGGHRTLLAAGSSKKIPRRMKSLFIFLQYLKNYETSYRLFAMSSFADLYPERRGGSVSPSVLQRATGTEYFSVVDPELGGAKTYWPPRS